ncbi:hypothetical protein ANN_25015 [Periplaneta americana]|uniref:Uncharacterized protein n=1 Tax=Periplaneta americana TaxID=6978 RepID=A0ABQ8S077_PERAM|nr:hypothetical protein ANN_25015 [Periplaneta americana]
MIPRSSTESYPAFAHIGLRENPGKNLNHVTFSNKESNPGHLVSRPDTLAVTPQISSIMRQILPSRTFFMNFQSRVMCLPHMYLELRINKLCFIVVAACVMTFEARDSAAKVVPARFKFNNTIKSSPLSNKQCSQRSDSRRSTSCQTKWDNNMGLFRVSSNKTASGRGETGGSSPCGSEVMNRQQTTINRICIIPPKHQPVANAISKSPSAPNLSSDNSPHPHLQNQTPTKQQNLNPSPKSRPKISRNSLHPTGGGCALLSPYLLQRQALSMDNPAYGECGCYSPPPLLHRQPSGRSTRSGGNLSAGSRESLELGASAGASCSRHGSQASMAMDLHLPNDCPVTLKVKDQSRKSETARRHLFVRQKPVEEDCNESLPYSSLDFRRESHSCSPRLGGLYARTNIEDNKVPHPRSRASTGESRYHRQPQSRRGSVSYSRSNTEEARLPHPRSRSNTGESLRSYQRREPSLKQLKQHYTRSNTEDPSGMGLSMSVALTVLVSVIDSKVAALMATLRALLLEVICSGGCFGG